MSYWSKIKTVICKKEGNGISVNTEYEIIQYDYRDRSIHILCDDGLIRMSKELDSYFYNEIETRNFKIETILND